jgi:ABC-type antimicrobial peptide transport system permease subunit
MKLRALRLSLRALLAHKLRAALSLTSVAVGVAAVVLTGAIGDGARQDVVDRISTMGTNLLIVRPAQVEQRVSRKAIRGTVTTLDLDDFDAVARLPLIAHAAPSVERPSRVKAGAVVTITNVRGTTPAFFVVRGFALRSGTLFENDDNRRVAVVGARIAEALSVNVGDEIRVRGVPFDIIGVLATRGVSADGSDEDNQIVIPLRTAMRRVLNTTWLNTIFVSVHDPARMDDARDAIATLLRARHGREDFGVQNTAKMMSMQRQVADSLALFGTGLGALALLVGGTGILALMMMSVRERTGEIGLRIAVGATPRDIGSQFLIEATLLALGGWLAGLAISALGAAIVSLATEWTLALPARALLASAAMVLIAGLGFGSFPARKASRMPPIEALLA